MRKRTTTAADVMYSNGKSAGELGSHSAFTNSPLPTSFVSSNGAVIARHPNGLIRRATALAAATIQRRRSISSVAAASTGASSADGCVLIQTIVRTAYAIASRGELVSIAAKPARRR